MDDHTNIFTVSNGSLLLMQIYNTEIYNFTTPGIFEYEMHFSQLS